MNIEFRSKPYQRGYTTILPFDQNVTRSYKRKWKDQYGLPASAFDDELKKDIFKINKNNRINQLIVLDVTEKYGYKELSDIFLDIAIKDKLILKSKVQIDLRSVDSKIIATSAIHAFSLASYQLLKYTDTVVQKHPLSENNAAVILVSDVPDDDLTKLLFETTIIARYQKEVMDLVNGPNNKVNAPFITKWIKDKARLSKLKITVLDKQKIKDAGLHAVLAVNRGSENNPAFVIAQYRGTRKKKTKTIGLVGKGVTFDTGGVSIKPSNNMHYMKSDMGGAAATLATVAAIAELKWPVNVIAIAPITDNCVDATAILPGDIINSYSGKTIEVINTDAEGRLILADALAYMTQNFEIDILIDLATLTGSSVRTFGDVCAAMFSNDEELQENLMTTGLECGEKLWPLPLWDDYDEEMKSEVADIKNLSTRPVAGAITAAKFLQQFTNGHPSWAHLDIAGVAFGNTKYGKGKNATGWGVHLLTSFIRDHLK